MMTAEVFRRIVAMLDEAGIPCMHTRSFAGSLHGVTRAARDTDLVIAPTADRHRELVAGLQASEYHVDLDAAAGGIEKSESRLH